MHCTILQLLPLTVPVIIKALKKYTDGSMYRNMQHIQERLKYTVPEILRNEDHTKVKVGLMDSLWKVGPNLST